MVSKLSWLAARPRLVMVGLFLAAMAPFLVTPVLPLIDHYNHMARFYVLAHIGTNLLLAQNYRTAWSVMPDIGLDIFALPFLQWLAPLPASHLIAIAILANLYAGVLYFHRALSGRHSLLVAVLLLPLLYSYIFNWGFTNFLLGLGFLFWAAGFWLAWRERPRIGVPVACALAILIFLTHGVAFALYGIAVVALEIGFFMEPSARDPRKLARQLGWLVLQAVIPVLLFVWWRQQMVSHFVPEFAGTPLPPAPHNGLYRLKTILRVEEGPAYWFDIATFLAQAAIAGFLLWRGNLKIARPAWILVTLAIFLVVATPARMFGVYYVSDRVPLFAALVLLGAVSFVPPPWTRQMRLACGILAAIVFVRLAAVTADWRGYADDYRQFRAVAAKIPPGSMTLGVMVGSGQHETSIPRCEMYAPLLIMQYGQTGPLFDDPNQHALVLAGRLKTASDSLALHARVTNERTTDFNPYMRAAAAAGFDYLLVCNHRLLTHPLPDEMELLSRTPRFALLRVRRTL